MSPQIVASPHEDVTIHGHILSVIIHREPGAAPEEGVRQFYETGALIDTGASDICVDYRIAQALKLRQVDQRTIGTAGGSVEVAVYNGVFEVPLLGFKRSMRLFAPRIDRVNYSVLIGRSLLKDYIVNFNGPTGEVHFIHPRELPQPSHRQDDDFPS